MGRYKWCDLKVRNRTWGRDPHPIFGPKPSRKTTSSRSNQWGIHTHIKTPLWRCRCAPNFYPFCITFQRSPPKAHWRWYPAWSQSSPARSRLAARPPRSLSWKLPARRPERAAALSWQGSWRPPQPRQGRPSWRWWHHCQSCPWLVEEMSDRKMGI